MCFSRKSKKIVIFLGNIQEISALETNTNSFQHILVKYLPFPHPGYSCSYHSNLEMEAKCLTTNLSYLNLNISRTRNGGNKCKKYILEQGRVTKHTDYFHFTQITYKNSQFAFKYWRFSTFTTFSLHSWSSQDANFCIPSAYVMSGTKRSFWF